MTYESDVPLALHTARRPDATQDRRLNLTAALVLALLAVALALSPPAAPPASYSTASSLQD